MILSFIALFLLAADTQQAAAGAASPACDTRNNSVIAIVVAGAGTAAVNGKYLRTGSDSDGLPIFSLDDNHQLYSRDHIWRIAFKGDYLFYISHALDLMGPPEPSPDQWSASGKGEGAGPSSIVCEYRPPTPPPAPPGPAPPGPNPKP